MSEIKDEFVGVGGAYAIKNGVRVQVEAPTLPPDHPDHPSQQKPDSDKPATTEVEE